MDLSRLLNSAELDPESRAALMQALAISNRRTRTASVGPDQLAVASGMPELGGLPDAEYQTSPSSLASMIARRDAAARRPDMPTVDDFTATPLLNGSDEELVRSQYNRGGSAAAAILEPKGGARPTIGRDGKMSYAGIKPVRSGDDLIANPKFRQLAQADPRRAATLYKALTGGDFTQDYQAKQKHQLAVATDWENGIRDGLMKGEFRRHPTMGWLERRRMVNDGINTVETWEPAEATVQQADRDYGQKGTGYERPAMASFLDDIPMAQRNNFLTEYYKEKKAGKTDREAVTAANSIIKTQALTPAQLATVQNVPAGAKPKAGDFHGPPAPTAATYPEQAAAQALAGSGQKIMSWARDIIPPVATNIAATGANIGTGILNIPAYVGNYVGAAFGAKERVMKPLPYHPFVDSTDQLLEGVGWAPEAAQATREEQYMTPEMLQRMRGAVTPSSVEDNLGPIMMY